MLNRLGRGERIDASLLLPLIYDELRSLAGRYMRHERLDHTLQPTALLHEAYMRMVDSDKIEWRGRAEFFSLAAHQIRRVLVDHARKHGTIKRGAKWQRVELEDVHPARTGEDVDFVALDSALDELAKRSERQARIVELRYFAGMKVEEVAGLLEVSRATVMDEWSTARAWLAGRVRN